MRKLVVCTMVLLCATCQDDLDTDSSTGALIGSGGDSGSGSGSGSGETCGCPPGTESRINDEGQEVCVPPECSVRADCPEGQTCVNGICEPAPCGSDGDCSAPLVCVDGACVEPPCDRCPSGYHCVVGELLEGDHACVVDSCTIDVDCPARMLCIDGACVEDSWPCHDDSDCPSGHCQLVEETPSGDDCDGEPCPAPIGVCVPPGSCGSDADCPTGERCDDGACTSSPPPCTTDADCPDGTCHVDTGTCLGAGGCVDVDDCPAGQLCLAGTCGVLVGCTRDEDCGESLRCITGVCTDCSTGLCPSPPPGPDAGVPGLDGGAPHLDGGAPHPDGGAPHFDGGLPGPDAAPPHHDGGIPPPLDAGSTVCAPGCGQRTGYHLSCPSNGTIAPSWCPASPSCSAMDACRSAQLASCNAACPGGCVTVFDGPASCCDCPTGGGSHDLPSGGQP